MVILITGVSSGFGLAMARQLVLDGHKVYGTVRRDVEPEPGVNYLRADVRNSGDADAAVAAGVAAEGRIDELVNTAGMGIGGPVEFTSDEDWQLQMDTNFGGQVRFARAVLPVMRSQGSGRIICFSSLGGRMGLPFQGFYAASKFAVEGLAESLQMELAGTGVKVILIEPGDFATGFTAARRKTVSEEAAAAYPRLMHSIESFESDEQGGLTPDVLARKISRIIVSRHPRLRYPIASLVQKLSLPLKAILPGRAFNALLNSFYS